MRDFKGLAACGGFSYGDVLGAGEGWAKSILFNARARDEFEAFFERGDTFALGVCNGCQMMSKLHEIIPGADKLAAFRAQPVRAVRGALRDGRGAAVAVDLLRRHGGQPHARSWWRTAKATPISPTRKQRLRGGAAKLVALRFVDNRGNATETYPLNPNGSPQGITGLTTPDGRFTILMPHPERVFRTVQNSWHPYGWQENGAWMRMFQNARKWVG